MSSQGRRMPTKKKIKDHWAQWLVDTGRFDSVHEVNEEDYCFACGFLADPTERAHIVPRFRGGSDGCDNLHLLCSWCHRQTEFIEDRDEYFSWMDASPRERFNLWLKSIGAPDNLFWTGMAT